jgi:uncharacterized cofD-like protein
MKKVVAIGAGTGLSTLLRGIRDFDLDITAVVAMTDDGACSGLLRKDLGILPPGDIRKCIAALSRDESLLVDLFQYRFENGEALKGRSLGNLLITALIDMTGNIEKAIEIISKILTIKGRVLPASLENADLGARFEDGSEIIGESSAAVYGRKSKITDIFLTSEIKANPKVLKAIKEADVILIGPGSLYTSLLTNFLIKDIKNAVNRSDAPKIYICNVSTEWGETDGFSVEDHLAAFEKYGVSIDFILANSKEFPDASGDGHIFPVKSNNPNNKKIIFADMVRENNYLYHDSEKLGKVILSLIDRAKVRV